MMRSLPQSAKGKRDAKSKVYNQQPRTFVKYLIAANMGDDGLSEELEKYVRF